MIVNTALFFLKIVDVFFDAFDWVKNHTTRSIGQQRYDQIKTTPKPSYSMPSFKK